MQAKSLIKHRWCRFVSTTRSKLPLDLVFTRFLISAIVQVLSSKSLVMRPMPGAFLLRNARSGAV